MMFAKYFEYYTIILFGPVFCGHAVYTIGSAAFAQLTAEGAYSLQCALKYDFKKLIAAINAIKKFNQSLDSPITQYW